MCAHSSEDCCETKTQKLENALLKGSFMYFYRFASALLILSSVMLTACSQEPAAIKLHFSDGQVRNLASYRGQHLLINYWAIWCKPCVEEIPELNALEKTKGVAVLGYNFDREQGDALAQQVAKLGIEFELLAQDPAALFAQKPPQGLPASLLISPQGEFVRWLMGPQTQASVLRALP